MLQLLPEQISLVEDQLHGRVREPLGLADGVKQVQRFLESIDGAVLVESLVVLREGHEEEHHVHVLKVMHPFLPLGPLPSDVDDAVGVVLGREGELGHTGRLLP